jgi:hypothetical protein
MARRNGENTISALREAEELAKSRRHEYLYYVE